MTWISALLGHYTTRTTEDGSARWSITLPNDIAAHYTHAGSLQGLSGPQMVAAVATRILRDPVHPQPTTLPGLQDANTRIITALRWHGADASLATVLAPTLTLDVLADNVRTLAALSSPGQHATGTVLDDIERTLQISRAWLLGTDDRPGIQLSAMGQRITDVGAAASIARILHSDQGARLLLLLEQGTTVETALQADTAANVIVVVERPHHGITTFQPWGYAPLGYQRVRGELMTVLAYTMRTRALTSLRGITVAPGTMAALDARRLHLAEVIGAHQHTPDWYPEDLVVPSPQRGERTTLLERDSAEAAARRLAESLSAG